MFVVLTRRAVDCPTFVKDFGDHGGTDQKTGKSRSFDLHWWRAKQVLELAVCPRIYEDPSNNQAYI